MSYYVTNFESLLLKAFPSNGMTKPLNAIIGVAIFSVNFPLQRKESHFTATLHISFQQQTTLISLGLCAILYKAGIRRDADMAQRARCALERLWPDCCIATLSKYIPKWRGDALF